MLIDKQPLRLSTTMNKLLLTSIIIALLPTAGLTQPCDTAGCATTVDNGADLKFPTTTPKPAGGQGTNKFWEKEFWIWVGSVTGIAGFFIGGYFAVKYMRNNSRISPNATREKTSFLHRCIKSYVAVKKIFRPEVGVATWTARGPNEDGHITLNSGRTEPELGTHNAKPSEVRTAVETAIDVGYRHIDTAYLYQNETEVGEAVRKKIAEGVVTREELFICTKLWSHFNQPDKVLHEVRKSLENLDVEYIDLILMTRPVFLTYIDENTMMPDDSSGKLLAEKKIDHIAIWRELEKAVAQNLVKAIGLSGCSPSQMHTIFKQCRIPPLVVQVDGHAYSTNKPIVDYCQQNGLVLVDYAPLGSPRVPRPFRSDEGSAKGPVLLQEAVVTNLATTYRKTPAQILCRYLIDSGWTFIPKSSSERRIRGNFDIWDFKLKPDDLMKLDGVHTNCRYYGFAPTTATFTSGNN